MKIFFILLVMFATIVVPSAVIGAVGYSSIQAIGRNPTAAPKIMMTMIIALIFTEAVAVIGLLVIFQIFAK